MPTQEIVEPISEKEQKEILARHHELVDKMNATLGGALKYDDAAILKRLQDPKEVKMYRMAQQIKRDNDLRQKKFAELEKKFGPNQLHDNRMSRTIARCLKTEDTLVAKRYNERLYQDYITRPERVVFHEYNKIFNFNPQELYDCGEDPAKLVEFYKNHTALCENGFNIIATMVEPIVDSKVVNSMHSMKKLVEGLNDPGNMAKMAASIDYFAIPPISEEQALQLVTGANETLRDPSESLTLLINNRLPKEEDYCTAHEMLERFKRIGVNINDKNFYVKYKAVQIDPDTRAKTEVSFDEYFKRQSWKSNDLEPNVTLEMRDANEAFSLRCITNEVKREYCSEFEKRMALKIGQINYNVQEIENRNKGGIWERYIRHSTSRQYKEFIAAMKDYNNPESPNYLNKVHLRGKANAYLVHKADQGYRGLQDMKGTSLSRSTLAMNVIQVLDGMENDEDAIFNGIEQKLVGPYRENVGAVKAEEVNLEGPKNEIQPQKSIEKEKQVEEVNENEIDTMSIKK